jgi:NADH-quinone oxidoreductase subunit M
MLNHGVSTGALFMLAGMIYERRHTYELTEFGGLASPMPLYATYFLWITLSSVALPLMNGFVGEFLILSGAFQAKAIYGIIAATGVIWSACYLLWMYKRVFYGEITNNVNKGLLDLSGREQIAVLPTAIMALVMGVVPVFWFKAIDPAVHAAITPATQAAMLDSGKRTASTVPTRPASARALPAERRTVEPIAVSDTTKISKVLEH